MKYIGNIYSKADYAPRMATDQLFELDAQSFNYSGEYDTAVKFVQEHQSKNSALWKVFAEQFNLKTDSDNGAWSGEFWGKMMRGACMVYKYTGDGELYTILEKSVRTLLRTQEACGRFSTYVREKEFGYWDMWCRKYVLLGMLYFCEICPDKELKEKIISALCRHLDYITEHIGEDEGKIDILDSTTHNNATWGALNSSSILEPTVRLYSITGKKEYLDFAAYLVRRGGSKWGNIYELALGGKASPYEYPVKKAYESMSYFEGVLEYYRVTGDADARQAFLNFMSKVIETDYTIIGSSGCTHELFDNSTVMQAVQNDEVKQETCVTVTLMKACYQALCLTGEAKYADVIERAGYNAMLGSINFRKNTSPASDQPYRDRYGYDDVNPFTRLIGGYTFDSYAPLYKDKRNRRIGGFVRMPNNTSYGCCACIGGAGVAVMPISSVMGAEDGIRINHPMNGTVCLQDLKLQIETDYPYGDKITVTVLQCPDEEITVGIRVPQFAAGRMTVNGSVALPDEKGYALIRKVWSVGEVITAVIPKEIKLHFLRDKVAITSGAITLALDEREENIDSVMGSKIVSTKPHSPSFPSREAWEIEFDNGVKVKAVDFASAGDQWDHQKSRITVWADCESK